MKTALIPALIAGATLAFAAQAQAAEIKVKMLNTGAQGAMVFEPAAVKLKPGDTVRFLPTTPGHNAETIASMLPPGATPVKGAMNKEVVFKFDKPGVYGIKCAPHFSMGMIFVAKVGDGQPNLAAAEAAAAKTPPLAKKRFAAAFAQVK
ncbi:MAG TPA: pseudoazurin [Caulobacteraceae bacterium]|nr:pseudoazurin [Caulobacteraceae bacterium]